MATRIIAVLNQKGGVGKTTSTVNLGAALALLGQRVLLVDMDPQANLTVHVGLEPHELTKTTYSLLLGRHGLTESVQETDTPGLRVVPSTLALANAEIQLASTVGRELVLREALDEYLDGPVPFFEAGGGVKVDSDEAKDRGTDFVLIDCPPSLGTLTMNALCAANEVLLPIQTEFFALQGVAGILESVKAVQRLNRGLRLSMVVPCMVDRRTTLARDVIAEVREYFGEIVTETEIRKNVKLAESPSHGKTIFSYEPKCNGAKDYLQLGREVLGLPLDDTSVPVVVPVVQPIIREVPAPVADEPAPGEAWIRMPEGAPAADSPLVAETVDVAPPERAFIDDEIIVNRLPPDEIDAARPAQNQPLGDAEEERRRDWEFDPPAF